MKDFPRGFRVTRFHKFNIAQPVENMREVRPKYLFYFSSILDVAAKNVNRFCFWRIVLDQLAIYNRFPLVQSLSILKKNGSFFHSEQTHSFFSAEIVFHAFHIFGEFSVFSSHSQHLEERGFVMLYRYKNLFMQYLEQIMCTNLFDRVCLPIQKIFSFLHWLPCL